jgi:DNA invertase Pin-like site-specific DNA recombinase
MANYKNVALYLRKSRDEEHESKEITLERHEKQLVEYCNRNNLVISHIYREVVSGETIENRPEMQKLLDEIIAGTYDGVVCMEIERLSRGNQLDQLEILETFKASGAIIYTLNKVYDLNKEEIDEEYFEFALFMSRREYKVITRRLMRGRIQASKDGYFIGSVVPYGFSKEKRGRGYVLIPNEVEAEVVRLIFNKYAGGLGSTNITHYLNNNGIKPRFSKEWTPNRINSILRNKVYIGFIHSKKFDTYIKGNHEPIVDIDLFERVNANLGNKPKVKRGNIVKNPLATLVTCSCCGYKMLRVVNSANTEFIRCATLNCPTKATKIHEVEQQILTELKGALKDFNYFLDNSADLLKEKRLNKDKELQLLKTEQTKKEAMLEKACELLESGVYSIDLFRKRTASVENDIAEIKKRITELETTVIEDDIKVSTAIPILEKVLEKYDGLEIQEKNLLLKSIIDNIVYYKTDKDLKLDITLKV